MAKQQITLSLDADQIAQACRAHVATMIDTQFYDLETTIAKTTQVNVKVTKRRAARKAKAPKVAAVKAAA